MKKVLLFVSLLLLSLISFSQMGLSQLAVNVPREETIIANVLSGRVGSPDNFNVWTTTWRSPDRGIQQLLLEPIWIVDPATGKVINALAKDKPIYNGDFTKMVVKIREGCYWSDGVEFTADDLVFTVELIMKYKELGYNASFNEYVKRVYKTDKYTVVFELKKPNARFHAYFLDRWGACRPLPKHVFEKVKDPITFDFKPPVGTGPYVLHSYDPGGYWTLWQRREDWQRTPTGKLFGMPQPKYVLFYYYGPTEKQVLAQNNHQLDMADLTMEGLRSVLQTNKYARAYRKEFPYIVNVDPCVSGVIFNNAKAPWNNKEVRWALTLAIDIVDYVGLAYDYAVTVSPVHIPATPAYMNWYIKPLEPWLKNLTITVDGKPFKVYDPDVPMRIAEAARKRGYKVPTDPNQIREIFGIGWYKYAPDVAEKLLIKNGFKRDKDGKWLTPEGKPWKITILTPPNPASVNYRNAFALSQVWKKFGIETEVYATENDGTLMNVGDFDVSTSGQWPAREPWGGHLRLIQNYWSNSAHPTTDLLESTIQDISADGPILKWIK